MIISIHIIHGIFFSTRYRAGFPWWDGWPLSTFIPCFDRIEPWVRWGVLRPIGECVWSTRSACTQTEFLYLNFRYRFKQFFSNVILLKSCEFSVNIISSNVDKLQDDSFWLMFLALTGSFWMYSRVGINTLASNNVGQINDIIHGIFMAFNGI